MPWHLTVPAARMLRTKAKEVHENLGAIGSFCGALARLLGPIGISTFAFAAWKDPPRREEPRSGRESLTASAARAARAAKVLVLAKRARETQICATWSR